MLTKRSIYLVFIGIIFMGLMGCQDKEVSFHNPPGGPVRDFSRWTLAKFLMKRMWYGTAPVKIPAGHIIPEAIALKQLQSIQRAGHQDSLTWIGHACFLLRLGGKTILTDPFMTKTAGVWIFGPKRFVPPGIAINHLPPIDVILISHNHYEHLDLPTIRALPDKNKIDVIVPLGLGHYFTEAGYTKVHELIWNERWNEKTNRQGFEIRALPAYHFSRRKLNDYNKTLWTSYEIKTPQHNIYFSGDTAYGKIFKKIGQQYGPFDIALLSIGAYEPRAIMKSSHVTPEEAIQLGKDIRANILVGMHWGTIVLTNEPPFEPPKRFLKAGRAAGLGEEQLWLMKIGETRVLSVFGRAKTA